MRAVGMALTGRDTAFPEYLYSEESRCRTNALPDCVPSTVTYIPDVNMAHSFITARLSDSSDGSARFRCRTPASDLGAQQHQLVRKFRAHPAAPSLRASRCESLIDADQRTRSNAKIISALLALTQRRPSEAPLNS